MRNLYFFWLAGIISVMTGSVLLTGVATDNGLGLSGDGYYYLNIARMIVRESPAILWEIRNSGGWLGGLLKQWPPLYPLTLAALGYFADLPVAARWLHVFFPLLIGGLVWALLYQHKRSLGCIFFSLGLILLAPHGLWLNWFAFSEFFFLLLQLMIVGAISCYLHRPRFCFLAAAIFFTMLACMTRYAGVAMVPMLTAAVWMAEREQPVRKKLFKGLASALISLLPVMLYLFWTMPVATQVQLRQLGWYPEQLFQFFGIGVLTLIHWFAPTWFPYKLKIIFGAGLGLLMIGSMIYKIYEQRRYSPAGATKSLQCCLLLYLFCYLLLLFGVRIFLFKAFWMTIRLSFPLFVWTVLLIALLGRSEGNKWSRLGASPRMFVIGPIVIIILIYAIGVTQSAVATRRGIGQLSVLWRQESEALAYVRDWPEPLWFVSNKPLAVWYYFKKPAEIFPLRNYGHPGSPNPDYPRQMKQLRDRLHRQKGLILYFNPYMNYASATENALPGVGECLQRLEVRVGLTTANCLVLVPENRSAPLPETEKSAAGYQ